MGKVGPVGMRDREERKVIGRELLQWGPPGVGSWLMGEKMVMEA